MWYKINYVHKQLSKAELTNNYTQKIQLIMLKLNSPEEFSQILQGAEFEQPKCNYINLINYEETDYKYIIRYLVNFYKSDKLDNHDVFFYLLTYIIRENPYLLKQIPELKIFYINFLKNSKEQWAIDMLKLLNTYVFNKYIYVPKYKYDIYNPFNEGTVAIEGAVAIEKPFGGEIINCYFKPINKPIENVKKNEFTYNPFY